MSIVNIAPGQIAYEAYKLASDGVSLVSGAPLPEWDEQEPAIRQAWSAVEDGVIIGFGVARDEDANEPEAAKVIVVVEANGKERRYPALTWIEHIDHVLEIRADEGEERKGRVATYQPNAWLSVREDGAATSDPFYGQGKKLAIALDALREISGWDDADSAGRARQAIEDIVDVDL